MPGEVVTQMYWYMYPDRSLCKVKVFFTAFTVSAEAFCLLTISVDRYRKVCNPYGWQMKPKMAKGLCGVIYGVAFILALPVSFYLGTHTEPRQYRGFNVTVTKCEKDEIINHSGNPVLHGLSLQGVLIVSSLTMLILYILVARTLLTNKNKLQAKLLEKCSTSLNVCTVSPPIGLINISRQDKGGHGSGNLAYMDAKTDQESAIRDIGGDRRTEDNGLATSDFGTIEEQKQIKNRQVPGCKWCKSRKSINLATRIKRKTRITFILSIVFIVTTILYFILIDLMVTSIFRALSPVVKAIYFTVLQLKFMNIVINPIVYEMLDPHFRREIKKIHSFLVNLCCFRKQ